MHVIDAIIEGLVQGFTEFLPVSSSAHLVFADHFLHLRLNEADTVTFDVVLHLGTLMAVIAFFYRDILALLRGLGQLIAHPRTAWRTNPNSRLAAWLILGTIPAGIAAITLKDFFSEAFQSVPGTASMLLITAAMLFWISSKKSGDRSLDTATWKDALVIGAMQAIAILPGVSRSGSTITGGLFRGLDRDAAPRFSFLLSIPIILAGGLMSLKDMMGVNSSLSHSAMLAGFLTAAVSGYLAIAWMLKIVRRGKLNRFGYYCLAAGLCMLAYWTFLVPKIDTGQIHGAVGTPGSGGYVIGQNAKGEFGPVSLDQPWLLQIPVSAGMVAPSDIHVILDGKPIRMVKQSLVPTAGKADFNLELVPLSSSGDLSDLPADGNVREAWVIVRNRWGIQNEVRIPMLVMPAADAVRPAA